jgi:hypothetical protein
MNDVNRKSCDCAAFGCPMLGTMSHSTSGGDWICWFHFGKEASQWQQVTNELNRLNWLVSAIRGVRATYGTDQWPDGYRLAQHVIRSNSREDLAHKQGELVANWLFRLEKEIEQACAVRDPAPPKQQTLAPDSWAKINNHLPETLQ